MLICARYANGCTGAGAALPHHVLLQPATNYVIVTLIMVCKHHHRHLVTDTSIMMVNILIALIETICHSASGDRRWRQVIVVMHMHIQC